MTIQEANVILLNRKDHWSHEIDDAEQVMIKAGMALADMHGYHIDDVKKRINDAINAIEEHTCSECAFYREDCKWCMNAKCLKRWVQPEDDACSSFELKEDN